MISKIFYGSEDIVSKFKLTGKRLHSLGCFLRSNKGYTAAVELLFLEDELSFTYQTFLVLLNSTWSLFKHEKACLAPLF